MLIFEIDIFTYSDAISIHSENWFTHVIFSVAFQKLLAEPDLEAFVVFSFQFITLFSNTIHILFFNRRVITPQNHAEFSAMRKILFT